MRITEIAQLIHAEIVSEGNNDQIVQLSLDSRSAKGLSNELYVAVKGNNHDGHDFLPELAAKGLTNFIVDREVPSITGCNILKVPSSILALQKIAGAKRELFNGPVIGITGSNGKTIVKEWMSTILSTKFDVCKSPKSFNSQIGVPLSIWPLSAEHDIGVFEAGISMPSEMERLASIIKPTLGVFTNIGSAHGENFSSQQQKIKEKLELFDECERLIYRAEHTDLAQEIHNSFKGTPVSWSLKDSIASDYQVKLENQSTLNIRGAGGTFNFKITFTDQASLENIVHCIIVALELGLGNTEIQSGISLVSPIKMRLELKKGTHQTYLIDDTYNNDLAGLHKALDFMDQQRHMNKKSVILSDFIQNHTDSKFFKDLNELLIQKGIHKIIAIGSQFQNHQNSLTIPASFYPDTESFLRSEELKGFKEELILIKGARQFRLERVSKALSEKAHKTILEVDLNAITHNLNYYRSLLKPQTKVMVVVKALAYGSGSTEVSKLLEFHKVDYLAVAYADEGVKLREEGIKLPIMVMNASEDDALNLVHYNLEPEVYSLEQLSGLIGVYEIANKVLPAHLILNTGMNRLGFNEEDLDALIEIITQKNCVSVKSIFSHLAASEDETHEEFTVQQVEDFRSFADQIEKVLDDKPLRHILNSGGIVRHNEFQEDMVRLGIGLHGIEVSNLDGQKLRNTATLKTVVSQVRTVLSGETIGYGRKGVADKTLKVATIAIGYADGYLRHFGNGKAYVMINGYKASVIGNVCMDMTMIDVTDIDVAVGDEVIIFGENPTVSHLAKIADTIPYEILTNVSGRVKRVFYSE